MCAYDGLDRLKQANKGTWNGATLTADAGSRLWDLDMLGNWKRLDESLDANFVFAEASIDTFETRENNYANEIDTKSIDGGTALPFEYDDAGNTTAYPAGGDDYTLVYDAWNRLVRVDIDTDTVLRQEFNGLHWRTVVKQDTSTVPDGEDQMRVLSYDISWRLIEEQVDDGWTPPSGTFTADRTIEQFWGHRYIDDPILRRNDPDAVGGYWHITDVQFSTVALLDNNAKVYERVWYTPYGEARHHWGRDYDGDRSFGSSDNAALAAAISGGDVPINAGGYVVEMDFNRDGKLSSADYAGNGSNTAVPLGQISDLDATSGPDNWIGYAGYVWEGTSGQYHVRFRSYSPSLGRWMQRDPAGYVDGMGLYEYGVSQATTYVDPKGAEVFGPSVPGQSHRPPNSKTAQRMRQCMTMVSRYESQLKQQGVLGARPEFVIVAFQVAAQKAFQSLSRSDRDQLQLFHNTQDCILSAISDCANCTGQYNNMDAQWIQDVTRDFMNPYVESYCLRAVGLPIMDAGWQTFFDRLDSGAIKDSMVPPSARLFEIAREMALNHINSDLRRALLNNGRGSNQVWKCIGDKVNECQAKVVGFLKAGGDVAGVIFKDYDVDAIRDDMRTSVP